MIIVTDKIIRETGLLSRVMEPLATADLEADVIDDVVLEPPFENLEQLAAQIEGKGYMICL
ncbi:iron-containing alcohol dehydrogenase [Domibacillus robiginosus]|uniref:iron-containing alcohol dehydrogenase n=1 Tax=Domibacillus robiginosus TaxID=1071054 RepID=UPI000A58C1BB|nr:iron-containing alcohol dehydrogenase [Domibacillus robiginosus]